MYPQIFVFQAIFLKHYKHLEFWSKAEKKSQLCERKLFRKCIKMDLISVLEILRLRMQPFALLGWTTKGWAGPKLIKPSSSFPFYEQNLSPWSQIMFAVCMRRARSICHIITFIKSVFARVNFLFLKECSYNLKKD